MSKGKPKVCIAGLGQIGFPVAKYAKEKGLEVYGYDISASAVENAAKAGIAASANWEEIPAVDAYIISVTTSQVEGCPNLSAVFDVCKKISQTAVASTLVSIESTIVPGTCRKVFAETFGGKVRLVHAPHRYWADQPKEHGVNQLRVIGAVNDESLQAGLTLYRDVFGIPLHACPSAEVAEMCKITENSHRFLQIAFAEDLKMLCAKIGMDFEALRAAMNTKWNVDLPEARDGIGRHCLPKDIRYVTSLAPSTLLNAAMQVDKQYREWLTKQKKPQ
ncbi:MAG: NAD(P)-binding domain-containing protein [Candidatus Bathyarchaeota archaeon]|nr:NAD(P)-binding domain-containing protein [Candidatus Bathyarchaeota archaeon]